MSTKDPTQLANPNADPIAAYSLTQPGAISSSVLQSPPQTNFQQPQTTPLYSSAAIPNASATSAYDTKTAPQNQAQELTNRIGQIGDALAGKAADTTALYKQQGFGTETDANGNIVADPGTADLTAKLTALQNEAQAIPLQLQQNATGRGITAGGLQPIQTAALRNNAIQALSVSSIISAKNGQLETANHYVDQALTQKYGPLEAELKAKTANLQLILNSPDYTNAEKKQAAQQQQIVAQQAAELSTQKQNAADLQSSLVKVIGNNPGLSSAQLQVLQAATDPAQLASAAASLGLTGSATSLPASAQEYQFAVQHGYKGSYSQYQNEDAKRGAAIAKAGATTITGASGAQLKPLTEVQAKDLTYASRADQANGTIAKMEATISGMNPASFAGQKALEGNDFTSGLVSDNIRQIRQAERNFATAALRRESGAAISASEFAVLEKQYFPRPGDDAQTLAQKAQNRATAIASFKQNVPNYTDRAPATGDLKSQVTSAGYNYDQMKADGYSDEDIKKAIGK